MHHIFKEEGANEFAVWGLHLIGMGAGQSFSRFAVDPDLLDWVGFTIFNLEKESGQYRTFETLMDPAYSFAQKYYSKKPIGIWELGSSETGRQHEWMVDAYQKIKKMYRIKLAMWAEYAFGDDLLRPDLRDSTYFSEAGRVGYRQILQDPYFISGPLEFLQKYSKADKVHLFSDYSTQRIWT